MSLLTTIIPFLILILVVVFIHEYGHYYFAKNMVLELQIFLLVLVKKFLAGMINLELDGKFVGYL